MMRQVNAATVTTTTMQFTGGEDVSAAVNHRQRMAAEQQRRLEVTLMSREDYMGTPEGQERLQRQEERSRMQEEELLVLRLVEAERQAARALQREKELEEERRIKEQYMAKIRAQREKQEKDAREKEEKRKLEMEKKMKALKEAADAKARAEFAAKQSALEEEARLAREKLSIAVESAQMQVEDEFGRAMQQEMIAEQERQRQIATEQEEWRAFQEREHEKQREATQLRRATMALQYEQDKQRRLQIHRLQKERAAQQAERKGLQNRQQEQLTRTEESKMDGEGTLMNTMKTKEVAVDDTNQVVNSAAEASTTGYNGTDQGEMISSQKDGVNVETEGPAELVSQAAEVEERPVYCVNPLQDEAIGKDAATATALETRGCDGMNAEVSVATIAAVFTHIKTARSAHVPVHLDIHRWVPEDQCYRSLRIVLPAASSGPLGFAMTSFSEYYNYYPNTGQLECVQYLLKVIQSVVDDKHPFTSAGADLYGDTVLHAATTSGNVAVVALLFESGCVKVDDRNHGRLTSAHVASNAETLTFLGDKAEADLLATDAEERMPLAYACLRNDVDSIQYLCEKHPEFVDYADVRGNTPLHVAAWLGLREASEVLVRFLSSIALHVTNEDGQNAAELARSSGMEDAAVFLEDAMAAAESHSRIVMAIAATYRGLKAEKQTEY
ncbi:hypothetical protein BBJ29_005730 [Phytophthora kernoviae]|uniref:Uncharacterized protein n=1 Tax=Phytophthora kernoviae TaxID=325452 RepID=A0A3F2RKZ9_9STRA|nr:hypothetical protein BBP00_00007193 [Phytophthora kernoviae]RLN65445.1 hypothetical protein BBJ29_005730 [Phytophthora kernoviae]